jgi:DeoR/GlpR family transcriptional regulator of sugar metabolism
MNRRISGNGLSWNEGQKLRRDDMTEAKMEEIDIDVRREKILELLNRSGKVKVIELSKVFNISEVTIRNDLKELEEAGLLERVHGGAVSTHKAYYKMSAHERMRTNEAEKRTIATATAALITDGDTVIINSGTTTLFVAQELKNVKNLTIVTNSLPIAQEVGHFKNSSVIFLGGNLNPEYQFTYGDDALIQLRKYKADKLILAVDGVGFEEGISTYHHLEAEVNRQMIARVNKTIVVADFTKVGIASFAYIDSLDKIDYLVTNNTANQEEIQKIQEIGIEVSLV